MVSGTKQHYRNTESVGSGKNIHSFFISDSDLFVEQAYFP
jgi:hypothetical protein